MSIPDDIILQIQNEEFDWVDTERFQRKRQKVGEKTERFLWWKEVFPIYEYTQTPRQFFDECVAKAEDYRKRGEFVRLVEWGIYNDEYGVPWGTRTIWKDGAINRR